MWTEAVKSDSRPKVILLPFTFLQWENSPRDEYYRYLPTVFQLALRGAPATEIAEYLGQVTVEQIGLSATLQSEPAGRGGFLGLNRVVIPILDRLGRSHSL